jgi:hypothetical protein
MTQPHLDAADILKQNPRVDAEKLARMEAELAAAGVTDDFRSHYRLGPGLGDMHESLNQRAGGLLTQATRVVR